MSDFFNGRTELGWVGFYVSRTVPSICVLVHWVLSRVDVRVAVPCDCMCVLPAVMKPGKTCPLVSWASLRPATNLKPNDNRNQLNEINKEKDQKRWMK